MDVWLPIFLTGCVAWLIDLDCGRDILFDVRRSADREPGGPRALPVHCRSPHCIHVETIESSRLHDLILCDSTHAFNAGLWVVSSYTRFPLSVKLQHPTVDMGRICILIARPPRVLFSHHPHRNLSLNGLEELPGQMFDSLRALTSLYVSYGRMSRRMVSIGLGFTFFQSRSLNGAPALKISNGILTTLVSPLRYNSSTVVNIHYPHMDVGAVETTSSRSDLVQLRHQSLGRWTIVSTETQQ